MEDNAMNEPWTAKKVKKQMTHASAWPLLVGKQMKQQIAVDWQREREHKNGMKHKIQIQAVNIDVPEAGVNEINKICKQSNNAWIERTSRTTTTPSNGWLALTLESNNRLKRKKTSRKTSHLSVQSITTIDEIEFGPICFWQFSFDFRFEWASACVSWPRPGMCECVYVRHD